MTKFEISKNIPKLTIQTPVLSMETVFKTQPKGGYETEMFGVTAFMFDAKQIGISGLVFGAPCQKSMSPNGQWETDVTIGLQKSGVYMTDLMRFEGCKMNVRMLSPGADESLELYMWGPYENYSSQSGQFDESSPQIPPSGVASLWRDIAHNRLQELGLSVDFAKSTQPKKIWPWTRIENALKAIASSIEIANSIHDDRNFQRAKVQPIERLLQFMYEQ